MKNFFETLIKALGVLTAIFLCISLYDIWQWRQFTKKYDKTIGVITKNKENKDKTFSPVIRFRTLDNQKVTFKARKKAEKKFNEGDTVLVYYNLLNTDEVHLATEAEGNLWLSPCLALLFGGAGALALWGKQRKRQQRSQLLSHGRKITAVFTGVQERMVLGFKLYVLTASWTSPYNEQPQLFESTYFLEDPQQYLKHKDIDVYIDKENTKDYYMDLEGIPAEWFWF